MLITLLWFTCTTLSGPRGEYILYSMLHSGATLLTTDQLGKCIHVSVRWYLPITSIVHM